MNERRKYQRIPSHLNVSYSITSKGIMGAATFSENISQTGILVDLAQKFDNGTRLILEISLPNEKQPVLVSGEVVWQNKIDDKELWSTGIQYVKIAEEDASRLSRYICEILEFASEKTSSAPLRALSCCFQNFFGRLRRLARVFFSR